MFKRFLYGTFLIIFSFHLTIEAQKFDLIQSFIGYTEDSELITFTPEPNWVLSGNSTGTIQYWDIDKKQLIRKLPAHRDKIHNIEFSPNGRYFVSTGEDQIVKIWLFRTAEKYHHYNLDFTPGFTTFKNNEELLIADHKGNMYLQSLNNLAFTDSLLFKNRYPIIDALVSPYKEELAITDHSSLKIVDLKTKKLKTEIQNPYSSIFSKVDYYSQDTIMTWSKNGIVSFWDIRRGKLIKDLKASNNFNNLNINDYSTILLTGYYEDRTLLIDLASFKLRNELNENIEIVNTYLTSKDHRFLVSSDEQGNNRMMELIGERTFSPLELQKRDVVTEHVISSKSETIIIEVWDNEEVDRDRISLNFNGKWILKDHTISKERRRVTLTLNPSKENKLIFYAENLGDIPPNTTALKLIFSDREETRTMRSTMKKSSSISLFYQP